MESVSKALTLLVIGVILLPRKGQMTILPCLLSVNSPSRHSDGSSKQHNWLEITLTQKPEACRNAVTKLPASMHA